MSRVCGGERWTRLDLRRPYSRRPVMTRSAHGSEGRRQLPPEFEEHAIGPAEADDVLRVAGTDVRDFGGADHVVFFADGAVGLEVSQDGVEKLAGNAGGSVGVGVAAQ